MQLPFRSINGKQLRNQIWGLPPADLQRPLAPPGPPGQQVLEEVGQNNSTGCFRIKTRSTQILHIRVGSVATK